jgi:hypothetical protein
MRRLFIQFAYCNLANKRTRGMVSRISITLEMAYGRLNTKVKVADRL